MLEDLTNSASDAKYYILNVKIAQNYIKIMFVMVNLDILDGWGLFTNKQTNKQTNKK